MKRARAIKEERAASGLLARNGPGFQAKDAGTTADCDVGRGKITRRYQARGARNGASQRGRPKSCGGGATASNLPTGNMKISIAFAMAAFLCGLGVRGAPAGATVPGGKPVHSAPARPASHSTSAQPAPVPVTKAVITLPRKLVLESE